MSLHSNRLLQGLSRAALEHLLPIVQPIAVDEDEVVFDEGDPADYLYLIESGTVRISKRGRGGGQETLSYLEEGDFFGEMAFLDPEPRSARATACRRTLLGRIDQQGYRRLLERAPLETTINLNNQIIRRLRQTNAHFIQTVLEAERLNLIGSMAGGILHDLKNPISVILGATSLLEEATSEEARARYTRMIRRSLDHMLAMTQELLDFARGASSLDLSPTPIVSLLANLDEQILVSLPDVGIRVDVQLSWHGELLIDRHRFGRVLVNIIKNAREAMPEGGALSLSVKHEGELVVFEISDTGVGIPSAILDRIFEPFVTYGKANGTGLGMAMARSVIEAHNGRISVTSTPGVGTTFRVTVPTVGNAGAPEAGTHGHGESLSRAEHIDLNGSRP